VAVASSRRAYPKGIKYPVGIKHPSTGLSVATPCVLIIPIANPEGIEQAEDRAPPIINKPFTTNNDLKGNLTHFEKNGIDDDMTYDLDNCLRSATALPIAISSSGNGSFVTLSGSAVIIQVDVGRAVDGSKFKLTADDRQGVQAPADDYQGVQALKHHKNYLDHVYAVSDKNGNLLEHYRYSAYGEVTIYSPTGQILTTSAIENTILWNTRRQDSLSGFYLYKYRHYAPQLGRWPSRDPIGEMGGINLYAFVGNDAVNRWDRLGLDYPDPHNPGMMYKCQEVPITNFFDACDALNEEFDKICRLHKTLNTLARRARRASLAFKLLALTGKIPRDKVVEGIRRITNIEKSINLYETAFKMIRVVGELKAKGCPDRDCGSNPGDAAIVAEQQKLRDAINKLGGWPGVRAFID